MRSLSAASSEACRLASVSSRSCVVALLQRQQLGQFVDLRVEAVEHLVLAGDFAAEQELRQHEDGQQEHDGQQQRRQRVDEARPVVDAAIAAPAAGERHASSPPGFFSASASCSSVRRIAFCSSDCASTQSRMICCSVRMFLTRPEMPSARLAMAVAMRGLEPPPSPACCAAGRTARGSRRTSRPSTASATTMSERQVGDRGEPVFELGVEAGLGAAGLQVEKAEDERAGKAEQRGREGRAHAGQRRGKPGLQRVEHGVGVARARDRATGWCRRSSRSCRADPRRCRAGRGRPAGRSGSARCRGSRRDAWRSNRASSASNWSTAPSLDERDDQRLHRRQQHRFGRPRTPARNELTQRTSRNSRTTCGEGQQDADHQDAEDQAVEAGIGGEGCRDLARQDRGDEARRWRGTPSSTEGRPAGSTACAGRTPSRRMSRPIQRTSKRPFSPQFGSRRCNGRDSKRNCDEIGRRKALRAARRSSGSRLLAT